MARTGARSRGDPSRAVGVVRVSTSKQDIGAAAQRAELERWADQHHVELVAIFEDIGVTGDAPLARRPGLVTAISALTDERAGKLVAVKRDRFARHRHTIADIERAASRAGAVLVTTDGMCTGEDTEAEEVNATVQDLVAVLEHRKIKARNKARAAKCIAEGRTHGGNIPYGFRRRAEGTTSRSGVVVELEPDPEEQVVVERMAELEADGLSLRKIADVLAAEGIETRQGKSWQAMAIKRVLDRRRR